MLPLLGLAFIYHEGFIKKLVIHDPSEEPQTIVARQSLNSNTMSDDSQQNSIFETIAIAAAEASRQIHHVNLDDVKRYIPEKLNHLKKGGIRNGAGRNDVQAQQLIEKIPPSQRAGTDGQSAASKFKEYLSDKDASHVEPHSQGGSSHPDNIKWENRSANRSRGSQPMTPKEQVRIDAKFHIDNLTGALQSGLSAAPKGAAIGAISTVPLSVLRNGLRVAQGEISYQEAAIETGKEVVGGAVVGFATTFTVVTVCVACPPIAVALAVVSPALGVAGTISTVHELYTTIDKYHNQKQEYYEAPAGLNLKSLKATQNEVSQEQSEMRIQECHSCHQKNRIHVHNLDRTPVCGMCGVVLI